MKWIDAASIFKIRNPVEHFELPVFIYKFACYEIGLTDKI
jgi:hypothetical protein